MRFLLARRSCCESYFHKNIVKIVDKIIQQISLFFSNIGSIVAKEMHSHFSKHGKQHEYWHSEEIDVEYLLHQGSSNE